MGTRRWVRIGHGIFTRLGNQENNNQQNNLDNNSHATLLQDRTPAETSLQAAKSGDQERGECHTRTPRSPGSATTFIGGSPTIFIGDSATAFIGTFTGQEQQDQTPAETSLQAAKCGDQEKGGAADDMQHDMQQDDTPSITSLHATNSDDQAGSMGLAGF